MADVAVEVIAPATNFTVPGNAVIAREQSRLSESAVRGVSTNSKDSPARDSSPATKDSSAKEKPPVAREKPSSATKTVVVKRAWGKLSSDGSSTERGSAHTGESQNRKDVSTVEIPKDTRVSA